MNLVSPSWIFKVFMISGNDQMLNGFRVLILKVKNPDNTI